MDTLTHTVLGACLGETIAGKKLGKKGMLLGAILNNLPDIDVAAQLFSDPAEGLLVHRGITHSIFMNSLLSLALAFLLTYLFRKREFPFKTALLLTASGLFLHIFMDGLTSYGTGWFEPFSHTRVSLNALFIIDLFFLLPMLVSTLALLFLGSASGKRRHWAVSGLALSGCYLLLTFFIKIHIDQVVRKDLATRGITHTGYMTTPGPLTNLLWYVALQKEDSCAVAYYSLFDRVPEVDYEVVPKHNSLLAPYRNLQEVQRLIRFSKGYYQVNKEDSLLLFSDLRFGQAGGWYKKNSPFVFNFNIVGHTGTARLQQARFKAMEGKAVSGLIERIKGKP